ncbi:MAG: hypothetical protein M1132_05905 [Chloroflexi bacterium]|nr:hypothetical protein [Chloroflexota bacterium]
MTDEEMFNRNADLQTAFMQYILDHPEIIEKLPPDYLLVILPEDDPELAKRNEALLQARVSDGKPVVVVRMKSPGPAKLRISTPKVKVLAS